MISRPHDKNKSVKHFLTGLIGLGLKQALFICNKTGISMNAKLGVLDDFHLDTMQQLILITYNIPIEADLKKKIQDNIKTMKRIKSYKGYRHIYSLPVNGQRTKTNAKTRKCRKIK